MKGNFLYIINMKKHYKPNLVYVLSIDGKFYVGCHTVKAQYLTENNILYCSGNPLNNLRMDKVISKDEYLQRTQLVRIEECNSKEEALNLEIKMINEYKEAFGDDCLNRCLYGNKHGSYKFRWDEKAKQNHSKGKMGHFVSEETKRKIGEGNKNKTCKRIRNKLTGEIYISKIECCRANNLSYTNFTANYKNPNSKYSQYEYVD